MKFCPILILTLTLAILPLVWNASAEDGHSAADWHWWRGPNRDGVSHETGWLSTWPAEGPKQPWKKSIGVGYATMSVSNGRVYAMGNVKNEDTVYCFDAETGDTIWKYSYKCKQGSWKGPRNVPIVDGNVVCTESREGNLFCFDAASGKIIWSKDLKADLMPKIPTHGLSCHPFIVGNMIIMEIGASGGSVVALDKTNGNLIWKSGNEAVGYSTPSIYNLNGRDYLAVFTGTALLGMDISTGEVLWRHEWKTEYACSIATPVVSGNRIFISSGYGMGCALLQINDGNEPEVVWSNQEMANHFNACVLWEGYLYGFHGAPKHNKDKGQLRCLDFETGEVKWKQDGLGKGSLMIADGKLVILSEKGELVIADASPEGFKEIARAKVLDGTCWTVPVLSGGRIYCRSHEGDLVCVDVRGAS